MVVPSSEAARDLAGPRRFDLLPVLSDPEYAGKVAERVMLWAGLSKAEVARRMGVQPNSVYQYFGSLPDRKRWSVRNFLERGCREFSG